MEPVEEKVVKCKSCDLFFGHSEKNTKCPFPFCRTEYVEVDPFRSREGSQRASASNGVKEKAASSAEASAAKKDKKGTTKTQKKYFKVWGKN